MGQTPIVNGYRNKTGEVFRLPTEAEWEYAARGGQQSKGYIYSGSNTLEEVAWSSEYAANSGTGWNFKKDKGTHPVGVKSPNELGIHDMSGNLSEWCFDLYLNSLTEGKNPKGPAFGSKKVLRGGSWDNKAVGNRVSSRNFSNFTGRFQVNKGFRIVKEKEHAGLKDKIEQYVKEKDFNGTVLVKDRDRTLFHESFGLADRDLNVNNTNNTQYAIASITKLFTSVIIMQLASENKINLKKSINYYLKDYNPKVGEKVTIHHLLTHTSGIENCEAKRTEKNLLPDIYHNDLSIDAIIKQYCSGPLVNKVGTVFDYNNGDYIILGKIIEEVCKKSYSEVLSERILRPLQLENTGLIQQNDDVKKLAKPYKFDKDANQYIQDIERPYQNYFASGAMYATAEDLMVFSDAVFRGELISNEKLDLLLRTYPETRSYGYGLWVNFETYGRTVSKVAQRYGRIWGINTLISHFIDEDITVVVIANTNKVPVSEFQHIVGEHLLLKTDR